jgi:hypothetical protein
MDMSVDGRGVGIGLGGFLGVAVVVCWTFSGCLAFLLLLSCRSDLATMFGRGTVDRTEKTRYINATSLIQIAKRTQQAYIIHHPMHSLHILSSTILSLQLFLSSTQQHE